ncbi:MAG: hypothetical protein ABIW36_09745 [Terrimesophilobacter sp.]
MSDASNVLAVPRMMMGTLTVAPSAGFWMPMAGDDDSDGDGVGAGDRVTDGDGVGLD